MAQTTPLSIDTLVQNFSGALEVSDFPESVKNNVPLWLERRVREFLCRPENRGRRRVKREPIRRARKTMRHLTHAVRHALEHVDANVRTKARELVRSIRCDSFEAIEQRASKFNGLLRRVGGRLREQQRKDERLRFSIVNDYEVVENNSGKQLMSVGGKLGLCVASRGKLGGDYHDRLRSKESEFWTIRRKGTAKGLLEIDKESRCVAEVAGRRNQMLKLKRKEACEILRKLDATADSEDTFSRVGAFSVILGSRLKDTTPIEFDGYEYRIWLEPMRKQVAMEKRRPAQADGDRKGFASVVPLRALRTRPSPAPKTTWAPLGPSVARVARGMHAPGIDVRRRIHGRADSLP